MTHTRALAIYLAAALIASIAIGDTAAWPLRMQYPCFPRHCAAAHHSADTTALWADPSAAEEDQARIQGQTLFYSTPGRRER